MKVYKKWLLLAAISLLPISSFATPSTILVVYNKTKSYACFLGAPDTNYGLVSLGKGGVMAPNQSQSISFFRDRNNKKQDRKSGRQKYFADLPVYCGNEPAMMIKITYDNGERKVFQKKEKGNDAALDLTFERKWNSSEAYIREKSSR